MKNNNDNVVGRIFLTKNYDKFTFLKKENRKPSNSQINQIIFSMNKVNLIEDFPIVVNKNFEILDGQGRHAACKKLGIPVCYVITNKMTIDDIPFINSVHTKWRMEDYLQKYNDQKNFHYIKFHRFMEKAELTKNIPANLSFFVVRGKTKQVESHGRLAIGSARDGLSIKVSPASMTAEFRLGLFEYPKNDKFVWKRVETVKSFLAYMPMLSVLNFMKAVIRLLGIEIYDHNRMMEQLKKHASLLHICGKQVEYFEMFQKIYNKGKQNGQYIPLRYSN